MSPDDDASWWLHADEVMCSRLETDEDERDREDREYWERMAWEIAMERDADLPDLADETTTRDEEGDES